MTSILGRQMIAVVAPLAGIHLRRIPLFALAGITFYGIVTAVAITSGMNWLAHR